MTELDPRDLVTDTFSGGGFAVRITHRPTHTVGQGMHAKSLLVARAEAMLDLHHKMAMSRPDTATDSGGAGIELSDV